jgi:hypothetical protein
MCQPIHFAHQGETVTVSLTINATEHLWLINSVYQRVVEPGKEKRREEEMGREDKRREEKRRRRRRKERKRMFREEGNSLASSRRVSALGRWLI